MGRTKSQKRSKPRRALTDEDDLQIEIDRLLEQLKDPDVRLKLEGAQARAHYRSSQTDGGCDSRSRYPSYYRLGAHARYKESQGLLGWLFDHWRALVTLFGIVVVSVILINFFVIRIF